ncbi:MAG: lysophospholipid acyltransferase family protein [Anaerolineaceae bacterium]
MFKLIRIIVYTFSLYVVTHLFVFLTLPFAIPITYLDRQKLPAIKQWFVKVLFAIVGKKMKVTGQDRFDPDRAYVIISNYPSFYAGFALIGAFPRASVVANAFMKKIPLFGQLLGRLGTIFVQPGRVGQGIRTIDLHLKKSDTAQSMIILPEGARTPDGAIHRFKRGFIYILRQTTLDLLPVTLNGLYILKPMRRFYLDPDAEPEMIIHAPLSNTDARKMSNEELLAMVDNVIGSVYRP